jgi:hypothetical protein
MKKFAIGKMQGEGFAALHFCMIFRLPRARTLALFGVLTHKFQALNEPETL